MNIEVDSFIVSSKVVRNLVVIIDYQLTMVKHISSVTRACHFHLRRIRQVSVASMNIVLKSWFKLSYYHELTTALMFLLVFLKRLCSHCRLSCTLLQRSSSKIFNHATASRPRFSNCTGFQSMPEFTSRSVSSCTVYTPTLHHTICPPWSHPAPPSCPGRVCLQRRLHLCSILAEVWKSSLLFVAGGTDRSGLLWS